MTSATSRFAYHGGTEAVIAPEEIRMSDEATIAEIDEFIKTQTP